MKILRNFLKKKKPIPIKTLFAEKKMKLIGLPFRALMVHFKFYMHTKET